MRFFYICCVDSHSSKFPSVQSCVKDTPLQERNGIQQKSNGSNWNAITSSWFLSHSDITCSCVSANRRWASQNRMASVNMWVSRREDEHRPINESCDLLINKLMVPGQMILQQYYTMKPIDSWLKSNASTDELHVHKKCRRRELENTKDSLF